MTTDQAHAREGAAVAPAHDDLARDSGGAVGPDDLAPDDLAPDDAAVRQPARIVACPDGPILVRGDIEIVDDQGRALPRRRRTVALCRCGGTTISPYCDGTHKANGFTTSD